MIIPKTTKRLLSAMMLGITYSYANGHRYISFHRNCDTDYPLIDKLIECKILPSTKIYGSIIDALNYTDFILKQVGLESLEEQFNRYNDWGLINTYDNSLIDAYIPNPDKWEDIGNYTDEYFESRLERILYILLIVKKLIN